MGDANRLYTSVSTEQVPSAEKSFRDEYEALNDDDRVSVLHTRRVKGYVGGSTHNNKKSHMCVGSHAFCIFFSVIRPFSSFSSRSTVVSFNRKVRMQLPPLSSVSGAGAGA